jgi:D-alanyl-D-alanine-carboxypeptidase/D-alanyl-D-alanine-endopeptidase
MRSMFLALALTAASAGFAHADDPLLREASELPGFVMFGESGAPGMVLVVVRGDNSIVLGFGETEKGNNQQPNGDSLVRLNSITKVFATEVLASLVSEGKLRLTDTLQHAADAKTPIPTFDGRQITLLDLATHSAALPREMGQAPEGIMPRAWPTRADRWSWLATYQLPWAPGTIASYSNVSFDFLADALETSGGKPYPDLLRERVTAPLGMADTGFAPTPEQCKRLMIGTGIGGPAPCVDTHATDGSGGLYSTGNDMARWLRHNLDDANETLALSHALYRQRQAMPAAIGFGEGAPMAGLGLGWVIVNGDGIRPTLLTKSGGGVGFMSYIVFAPGRGVGVFVAMSTVNFGGFGKMTEGAISIIENLVTR